MGCVFGAPVEIRRTLGASDAKLSLPGGGELMIRKHPILPSCAALVAAAALAGAALIPGPAGAVDVVIGGRAEACSKAAKIGLATPDTLENCSLAILQEPLPAKDLAGTYVNRGTMFLALMNWGAALSDFDQALHIYPTMGEAYVNRGGALIGMHRYKEAVDDIDRGIAMNPEQLEKAYANRALAKWSLDDLKGAYLDFTKAQELKPDWDYPAQQLAHFTVTPGGKTASN